MSTIDRQLADARLSRVVTHNGIAYLAGITADNRSAPIRQQTEEILEFSTSQSPLRWHVTLEHLPVENDGCVRVPTAPGLGVTLNEEFVKKYLVAESGR